MPRKSQEHPEKPLKKNQGALRDSLILDYLREHPTFIADHPELLDSQELPARFQSDHVADFQHILMERLRGEIARLRTQQEEIIANSRDNQTTQARIHKAAFDLLEAESFTQFIDIIVSDLAEQLEVDAVRLCIEKSALGFDGPLPEGLRILERGHVANYLGRNQRALLREEAPPEPDLFGELAPLIRSDALIRLDISADAPPAMIAFGTRHPGYFHSGQGTELLSFLSNIIGFGVRSWLDLPRP